MKQIKRFDSVFPKPPKAATKRAFDEVTKNPPKILAKTAKKFGAKRAAKQKVAIALNKARKGY